MVGEGPEPPPPPDLPRDYKRLYLDAGDLIHIADGTVDGAVVEELIAACEAHVVWLVISVDHFQDMLLPDEGPTLDRIATAFERFRYRGLVTTGPEVIEPWPEMDVPQDILIRGVANIREVMTSDLAAPHLAKARAVQDALHAGAVDAKTTARQLGRVVVPGRHRDLGLQSTITQIRGWMGTDVAAIVEHHAEEHGRTMTEGERAAIAATQEPLAAMQRSIGPLIDELGLDRTELMRRAAYSMASDGFRWAPGAWLGGKLWHRLWRNTQQQPKRTDVVDGSHVMHFPYVDIASCDGGVFDAVIPFTKHARGSRPSVTLFRNGHLPDIIKHVRTLPTKAELAALRVTSDL